MDMNIILWALGMSVALNAVMFLIAFVLQTDKFTDITYSLSFMAIAVFVYLNSGSGSLITIATIMVLVWASRLGVFLLYRVSKKGKDSRFDEMRSNFLAFARFWIGQAIVAWALMLPIIIASPNNRAVSSISLIGLAVWLAGLIIETTADLQKIQFNMNPKNKGNWIDVGIWRYSRHPNYFGEITIWVGIYLYVLPVLSGAEVLLGLVSPLLIIVILRYVSGVPILEKLADKKWGKDSKYKAYKAKTNLLIPGPVK